MASNEILYILLPDFASHEMVYLMEAISSDEQQLKANPRYINKIIAPTMEAVTAIGGFRVLPDYSFGDMPDDYAALVLVGGYGWLTPYADAVAPIVNKAIENGKIVGAICNGASFMAKYGFLNKVKHTGNGLDQLKLWGGDNYTNPESYIHRQSVSDGRVVTLTARECSNLQESCCYFWKMMCLSALRCIISLTNRASVHFSPSKQHAIHINRKRSFDR